LREACIVLHWQLSQPEESPATACQWGR
jgi:hypothetical protein